MCLSVAITRSAGIVLPARPGSRGPPPGPSATRGTGPRRRSPRTGPSRGSRATSTTGASTCCAPRARTSLATAANARSTSSGFQVLARAIACGKLVASGPISPCSASSWKITGMPRRVFSFTHFWMALVNSAWARAPWPSLGRSIRPMPDLEPLRRPGGVELPLGVGELPLGVPEAHHLRRPSPPASCARAGRPPAGRWGGRGSGSPGVPSRVAPARVRRTGRGIVAGGWRGGGVSSGPRGGAVPLTLRAGITGVQPRPGRPP